MCHIQKLIKLHNIIKDLPYDHRPAPFCSNPYEVIKPPLFGSWGHLMERELAICSCCGHWIRNYWKVSFRFNLHCLPLVPWCVLEIHTLFYGKFYNKFIREKHYSPFLKWLSVNVWIINIHITHWDYFRKYFLSLKIVRILILRTVYSHSYTCLWRKVRAKFTYRKLIKYIFIRETVIALFH